MSSTAQYHFKSAINLALARKGGVDEVISRLKQNPSMLISLAQELDTRREIVGWMERATENSGRMLRTSHWEKWWAVADAIRDALEITGPFSR